MPKRVLERQIVHNSNGFLKGDMRAYEWGDLVQLEDGWLVFPQGGKKHRFVPRGTIWVFNREKAGEKAGTTHLRYDSLYERQRADRHAVSNYGTRTRDPATEKSELERDIALLRGFSEYVLYMRRHLPEQWQEMLARQEEIASRYEPKRAAPKVDAQEYMARSADPLDSRGQPNPFKNAMESGTAIGNIMIRLEDIPRIARCLDRRSGGVFNLITWHLQQFWDLWRFLEPGARCPQRLARVMASSDRIPDWRALLKARDFQAIQRALVARQIPIASMHIRPFCRNAAHTVADLDEAIVRCRAQDAKGLVMLLKRIKEGIRFIFVLDFLQMDIIGPLSDLLERLRRQVRAGLIPRLTDEQGKLVIRRELAPDRFAALQARIDSFEQRLAKCDDTGLKRRSPKSQGLKSKIQDGLVQVRSHITADDWNSVKRGLDEIADML